MRHGSWQDIEIGHDELGAPLNSFTRYFKDIYETSGYTDTCVRLVIRNEYTMRYKVILEGA